MALAQADQILDRGMIRPPSACAWLKRPGPDRVNYKYYMNLSNNLSN